MNQAPDTRDFDVTVLIPCLNEEATISGCVEQALKAIANAGVDGEVLVVDNNSTDRSAERAAAAGARVVAERKPGYGSAYIAGLNAARGRAILMGDGDGTYDFRELGTFLALIDGGADFVLGSRLRGTIEKGAMPWHHRWIGNPALTGMLNLLFRCGVSDAHCGLRMIRASALPALAFRTPGMEFASEMVIKAAQQGLVVKETPIDYAARPTHSASKLKSFRDGLRHVRYMLAWASSAVLWVPALLLGASGAIGFLPSVRYPGGSVTNAALLVLGGILAHAAGWLGAYRVMVLDPQPGRHRLARWIMARSSLSTVTACAVCLAAATLPRSHGLGSQERVTSIAIALVCTAVAGAFGMASIRKLGPADEPSSGVSA